MRARPVVESLLLCAICLVAPMWIHCTPAYSRGDSLVSSAAGESRELTCLDVAVEPYNNSHNAFRFTFGNPCRNPVALHLERLTVTGVDDEGAEHPFRLYDPRHEVRATTLYAQSRGEEVLMFRPPEELAVEPAQVCIDLGRLTEPVHIGVEPVCFGARPNPLMLAGSGRMSW